MNTTFYNSRSWIELPPGVWMVLAVSLALKLALIGLNGGEYTDGIIQLQLWDSPVVFFPPGYSASVWLFKAVGVDLLYSGRLVSIVASVGTLWVFYLLARSITNDEREAFWALLFLALSPIFNRWSLRVMTDSLFCLLFVQCCRELYLAGTDRGRSVAGLIAWTGAAALTRYQGLYFLPFAVFLFYRNGFRNSIRPSLHNGFYYFLALSFWGALVYWIAIRGFGHQEQFIERGSMGFWITLSAYYSMFETYILYWPWAVTYGLFVLGVFGLLPCNFSQENYRGVVLFFWMTVAVFLVAQSLFLSFQYRYMLPIVPLWCLVAARGWKTVRPWFQAEEKQRAVYALVVANLVLMTAAVLYFQRATFADLSKSAEALKVAGRNARIVSDETYREGVYNVKMKFWSGMDMEYYYQTELKTGDVVVLHNAYSDLAKEAEKIQSRFEYTQLGVWRSDSVWGEFATLPLLPDIMVLPQGVPLTSNPPCMNFRFVPQYYYSVILRLGKEKIQ